MGMGTQRPDDVPAWPLGCGLALLGFGLGFPIAWLVGAIVSVAEFAPWLGRAAPLLGWLVVPLLMLGGWSFIRRANHYAARALLWGIAFTLIALAAATALFDLVDRLNSQ